MAIHETQFTTSARGLNSSCIFYYLLHTNIWIVIVSEVYYRIIGI